MCSKLQKEDNFSGQSRGTGIRTPGFIHSSGREVGSNGLEQHWEFIFLGCISRAATNLLHNLATVSQYPSLQAGEEEINSWG